jgi:predicted hydrocarbon binding protein
VRFLSVLKDRFGSAGESMLFAMSRDFGRYDTRKMMESDAFKDLMGDNEKIFEFLLKGVEELGWGKHTLDLFDLIKGEVRLSIENYSLANFCEDQSSPQCFFMKGTLSGFLKEVTEQDFYPEKIECDHDNSICRVMFKRS